MKEIFLGKLSGETELQGKNPLLADFAIPMSGGNLNELTGADTGNKVYMGQNMAYAPSAGWWFVHNYRHNTIYGTQIAYSFTEATANVQMRNQRNGNWEGWQRYAMESNQVTLDSKQTFIGQKLFNYPIGNPNTGSLNPLSYVYGGTNFGGLKIFLPYNVMQNKMISFILRIMDNYEIQEILISGYLYSVDNNWYEPKAVMSVGTKERRIVFGKESDGRAYIWTSVDRYFGVHVLNAMSTYSNADWNTGWEIKQTNDIPNIRKDITVYPPYSPNNFNITNMVTTDTIQNIEGSKSFMKEVNLKLGGIINDPDKEVERGLKIHSNGLAVNGDSKFNHNLMVGQLNIDAPGQVNLVYRRNGANKWLNCVDMEDIFHVYSYSKGQSIIKIYNDGRIMTKNGTDELATKSYVDSRIVRVSPWEKIFDGQGEFYILKSGLYLFNSPTGGLTVLDDIGRAWSEKIDSSVNNFFRIGAMTSSDPGVPGSQPQSASIRWNGKSFQPASPPGEPNVVSQLAVYSPITYQIWKVE